MICVECSTPIQTLYEKYKGDHIRLTICSNCHKVADRYIEFDKVLLFIDLMLLKPQAYRHTIYNQSLNYGADIEDGKRELQHEKRTFFQRHGPFLRLLVLMLLFEVYLTWAYEEKNYLENVYRTSLINQIVLELPRIMSQYLFFLTKAVLDTVVLHLSLQFFTYRVLEFGYPITVEFENNASLSSCKALSPTDLPQLTRSVSSSSSTSSCPANIQRVHFSRDYFISIISSTILLSNLIKLFPIVMLIWPYDIFILNITANTVQIIHLVILIEAIHIVLLQNPNNHYWKISLVVFTSHVIKLVVTRLLIMSVFRLMYHLPFKTLILDEIHQLQLKLELVTELFKYLGL
ncbi:hypothetical protein KL936_001156 [Ogataea polymorpha]|uniref:Protein ARV n=1 Tax=Ogataea polymorpha TaxID=460523 RepID=A0A1B7SLQ8_9ASCO|nr:uncharacterized protein OGAPODRAFT_6895 [Ogataea polymorpha]KAG7892982.1 hypothetical protein KL936_001156 [Ogataea polymorpha]KAG7938166.1 hypothetical protein KL934_000740 [Ogataea polymorpha]KAH3670006.1 hypothetical protein OGATHE_002819 [Ogataea polymorpha]OBA17395.1 hypothetical protein OGAPODRAFT_6895 [Ogataea polymorpha]